MQIERACSGKTNLRRASGLYPHAPDLIPVSVALSDKECFYCPLDGMLVHHGVTPSFQFGGNDFYTCMERGTVRVKYLSEEQNAKTHREIPFSFVTNKLCLFTKQKSDFQLL